jgi:NitT/TauT family transport system substrate-binding protein
MVIGALVLAALMAPERLCAETIKIAVLKTTGSAPLFVAEEKGYFALEGLATENVYFDAGQPAAVAVVAGSVDFGMAGLGGGLYGLAYQGALVIIAAQAREVPGFHNGTYLVSNRAYAAGLRTLEDIPEHSVAMTAIGGPFHYALALVADKYGFGLNEVRLLPLQSIANNVSAVVGGTADVAMAPATQALPVIDKGEAKVLGYVGEETPWQLSVAFTATKTANNNESLVRRFLRAYDRGAKDMHDAFTDAGGHRKDMPTAAENVRILSRVLGQPPAMIAASIQYVDREARLDIADVMRQIAWFKTQGLLKGDLPKDRIIDARYVVPLPSP